MIVVHVCDVISKVLRLPKNVGECTHGPHTGIRNAQP